MITIMGYCFGMLWRRQGGGGGGGGLCPPNELSNNHRMWFSGVTLLDTVHILSIYTVNVDKKTLPSRPGGPGCP